MPHKPANSRTTNVQFVSCSLTVDLKSELANWAADNKANLLELIERTVQAGYRLSIKEENEGYSASLASVRTTGPNLGLVLVERGSSPERTLLRLLWAHNSLFKLVWPRSKESPEDDW